MLTFFLSKIIEFDWFTHFYREVLSFGFTHFFRRFLWPEKQNPQTFLLFGCMINSCVKWILHIVGHVLHWVILHLNLNRNNKVHREFCLKSNLKTISALAVFAFHLVGNNTWIIFLVEGGRRMVKIFGNFIKTTFAPLASAFDPICFWYHLDYLSSIQ